MKDLINEPLDLYGLESSDSQEQRAYIQKAYLAVREFCSAIGVEIPSIYSYYDYLTFKTLATGAGIGAAAAVGGYLWYKSQ